MKVSSIQAFVLAVKPVSDTIAWSEQSMPCQSTVLCNNHTKTFSVSPVINALLVSPPINLL